MNLEAKIYALNEDALATVLAESQKTLVTQELTAEDIKQKLPTEPLLREFLLAEVETNVIAQAATHYAAAYLSGDLIGNDLVMDCIHSIEDELGLTNSSSQFIKNRKDVKALYLNEDNLYDKAIELADDYLSGIDFEEIEDLDEDFGAEDLVEQLMICMIFYTSNPLSHDQLLDAQLRIFRGE